MKQKRFHKKKSIRIAVESIIVLLVIAIGVKLIVASHAQTPYASSTASSGTLNGLATLQGGAQYVQFGFTPTSALAIHVDGSQLINGQGKAIRILGVNVSGTEGGCVNEVPQMTYWAPLTQSTANSIASWHMNAVRVPLNEDCWLGINGVSSSVSGQAYQDAIKQWVSYLHDAGLYVILDLHWSAPGTTLSNAQYPMPDQSHSYTFWQEVANAYKSDPAVLFDLFNEPYLGNDNVTTTDGSSDWSCWWNGCMIADDNNSPNINYQTEGMKDLISAVRGTGATQPILLGGLGWAGDPCGVGDSYGYTGTGCPEVNYISSSNDHQLIVNFHNYYNSIICGADTLPNSCLTTRWSNELNPINKAGYPMVTDEFGEDDCSANFMNNYMSWADSNNESYMAWQWGTSTDTTCTEPPNSSFYINWALLNNYNGTPNSNIPQGTAYQTHLAQPSVYGTE